MQEECNEEEFECPECGADVTINGTLCESCQLQQDREDRNRMYDEYSIDLERD